MATIINLAQDFVGSNNMNLLMPNGQFGTRDQGGKDHAAARYIFTELAPVIRNVMHPADDAILTYQQDDGKQVEPEWYMPTVPMVLINGAEGIGNGERHMYSDSHSVRTYLYDRLEYHYPELQPRGNRC